MVVIHYSYPTPLIGWVLSKGIRYDIVLF